MGAVPVRSHEQFRFASDRRMAQGEWTKTKNRTDFKCFVHHVGHTLRISGWIIAASRRTHSASFSPRPGPAFIRQDESVCARDVRITNRLYLYRKHQKWRCIIYIIIRIYGHESLSLTWMPSTTSSYGMSHTSSLGATSIARNATKAKMKNEKKTEKNGE